MSIKTATLRMPQKRSYVHNTSYRRPIKHKTNASSVGLKTKEILVTIFALLFLALGIWASLEVRNVANEVAQIKEAHKRLITEKTSLTAQMEKMTQPKELEAMGKRLGLHPPKESQIIYLK